MLKLIADVWDNGILIPKGSIITEYDLDDTAPPISLYWIKTCSKFIITKQNLTENITFYFLKKDAQKLNDCELECTKLLYGV